MKRGMATEDNFRMREAIISRREIVNRENGSRTKRFKTHNFLMPNAYIPFRSHVTFDKDI